MPFELRRTALDAVDFHDDTYRIVRPEDIAARAAFVQRFGLLCGPILAPAQSRWVIVSGFSLLAACRHLGWTHVDARIPGKTADSWQCALWAVAENVERRPLDPLETARALRLLRRFAPTEMDFLQAARDAGLPGSPERQARYTFLCDLPDAVQEAVANDTLTLATAASLGRMEPEIAARMADLLVSLRFGANKQREVIELAEEISKREGRSIAALLEAPELTTLLSDPDADRAQKGNRLRTYLYSRRFPALSAARKRFDILSRSVCPDPEARLTPPPGFEGRNFQLTLSFSGRADLARHHTTIDRILAHPELDEALHLS